MTFVRPLAAAVLATAALQAHAADPRTFLTPDEVKAVLTGNKAVIERAADKAIIEWDVRPNGRVRALNRGSKNLLSADWKFSDTGAFCMRWRGIPKPDCYYYFKDGDKLKGTEARTIEAAVNHTVLSTIPLKKQPAAAPAPATK